MSPAKSVKYHYCIVREDLPLGALAAQLVHAAGESGPTEPGTHAVVLSAKDQNHLLKIERQLTNHNIQHHSVREPDAPYYGELMAIGIFPICDRSLLKPVVKKLRLLGQGGKND